MTGLRRHPQRGDCLLCGLEAAEVEFLMVRWRDARAGEDFANVNRCVDRAGCRARVESIGDDWPVADGTPGTVRQPRQPVPPVEPPPALAAEEGRTWFD